MSNRYIEASAEDVASSVKVRVVLEEGERRVHLCNLPYRIASGGTTDVVRCDFLADIVVRGIRSLEAEQQVLGARADERDRVTVRLVGDYEHDLDNLGS